MSPEPEEWVLVLRPSASDVPVAARVRKLLKRAGELNLRCVAVRDAQGGETEASVKLLEALAERVAAQKELLERKAEKAT